MTTLIKQILKLMDLRDEALAQRTKLAEDKSQIEAEIRKKRIWSRLNRRSLFKS